jgi:hypothetical protein
LHALAPQVIDASAALAMTPPVHALSAHVTPQNALVHVMGSLQLLFPVPTQLILHESPAVHVTPPSPHESTPLQCTSQTLPAHLTASHACLPGQPMSHAVASVQSTVPRHESGPTQTTRQRASGGHEMPVAQLPPASHRKTHVLSARLHCPPRATHSLDVQGIPIGMPLSPAST